jgi:hypothetical protein
VGAPMSRILALSGFSANMLRRCSGVVASSQNTLYPATSIYDGNPGNPWLAGSLQSPQFLTFDMNHIDNTNGGVENWSGGNPVGWLKTQNPASPLLLFQETDPSKIHGGSSSARFEKTTSSQHVLIYEDFEVPSGSVWQFRPWVLGGKAANGIFVQNLDTGQYLKPLVSLTASSVADQWDPAPVLFHGFAGSGLAPSTYIEEVSSLFRVEDWWEAPGNSGGRRSTYKDTTTIRVMIGWPPNTADVGIFWVDDFVMIPALDWASVHYHNLRSRDQLRARYSDDGATYTDLGAFDFGGLPNRRQEAYIRFTLQAHRWAQLRMDAPAGFNVGGAFEQGSAMIGEAVLSQARQLAVDLAEEYPAETGKSWMQHRDERGIYAYAQEDQPTRTRPLTLQPQVDRETGQAFSDTEMLWERSRAGAYPMIIAPQDDARDVFYGRLQPETSMGRQQLNVYRTALTLRGFPPPVPI